VTSTDTDDTWLEPDEPNYQTFYLMFIAAVIVIAAVLVFSGVPIHDPLVFLPMLIFVVGFGLICALLKREVYRSIGLPEAGYDTPI